MRSFTLVPPTVKGTEVMLMTSVVPYARAGALVQLIGRIYAWIRLETAYIRSVGLKMNSKTYTPRAMAIDRKTRSRANLRKQCDRLKTPDKRATGSADHSVYVKNARM